jgi:hypothetical protein
MLYERRILEIHDNRKKATVSKEKLSSIPNLTLPTSHYLQAHSRIKGYELEVSMTPHFSGTLGDLDEGCMA